MASFHLCPHLSSAKGRWLCEVTAATEPHVISLIHTSGIVLAAKTLSPPNQKYIWMTCGLHVFRHVCSWQPRLASPQRDMVRYGLPQYWSYLYWLCYHRRSQHGNTGQYYCKYFLFFSTLFFHPGVTVHQHLPGVFWSKLLDFCLFVALIGSNPLVGNAKALLCRKVG